MLNKKVALISNDKIGSSMAGPGIRYFELAKALSKHFSVTLIVPDGCDLKIDDVAILKYDSRHASKSISTLMRGYDFVIAQFLGPVVLKKILKGKIRFIADLYDPQTIEILEQTKHETENRQDDLYNFIYFSQALQFFVADYVICSSEKQKDLYIGTMVGQGILTPELYRQSPDLNKYISLVPFGLPSNKPISKNPTLISEKFPQIKTTDKIIFWGGGIWNWFDPLSVVKAVENISKKRSDVKMVFLGVSHPNSKIKKMKMAEETIEYCKKNNLLDKTVFFNFGWAPYGERVDYLLRSSIGISTHLDNLETRFSFRTRVLDYLWAELPMITTTGDSMSELVKSSNLGRVVGYQDVSEIEKAILLLLDNEAETEKIKNNIRTVKKDFEWDTVVRPIVEAIRKNDFVKRKRSYWQLQKLSFYYYLAGFKKKFFNGK